MQNDAGSTDQQETGLFSDFFFLYRGQVFKYLLIGLLYQITLFKTCRQQVSGVVLTFHGKRSVLPSPRLNSGREREKCRARTSLSTACAHRHLWAPRAATRGLTGSWEGRGLGSHRVGAGFCHLTCLGISDLGSSACEGGDGLDFWCYGSRSSEELPGSLGEALSALQGWGDVTRSYGGEVRSPWWHLPFPEASMSTVEACRKKRYGTKEVEGRRQGFKPSAGRKAQLGYGLFFHRREDAAVRGVDD